MGAAPTRQLDAGVLIWLTREERQRLRDVLFAEGGVSLQAFFRSTALAKLREAERRRWEVAYAKR